MRRLRPPGRLSTSTGRALSDSWKATLPCTKAEAEAVAADISQLVLLETTPVLMTREPDPVRPEEWLLEAYFDEAPSPDTLSALKALAPSAGDVEPIVERLAEEDWVTLSQAGLADRKSVVTGKSVSVRVDPGGRLIIKKKRISK